MSPQHNIMLDVEQNIRAKVSWKVLPLELKKVPDIFYCGRFSQKLILFWFSLTQALNENEKRYEKMILEYSLKNQLRYRGNLGKWPLSMIAPWSIISLFMHTFK